MDEIDVPRQTNLLYYLMPPLSVNNPPDFEVFLHTKGQENLSLRQVLDDLDRFTMDCESTVYF